MKHSAPSGASTTPEQRAREKAASREQDAADLASGRVTVEQLRRRNVWLRVKHQPLQLDRYRPVR